MALPEGANGELKPSNTKMVNAEALAALEQGWLHYKESLELRKSQSHVKTRLNFHHLSLGDLSPSSASSFSFHTPTCVIPSRKACILCIDGGGSMRSSRPMTILCYLEQTLQKKSGNPNARIADFFDIVAGTSVGGLIATMLCTNDGNGRPLFSAVEANKLITDECKDRVFKISPLRPQTLSRFCGLGSVPRCRRRYSTADFDRILKRHLVRGKRKLTLQDTIRPVLIPCYDMSSAGAFLFSRADAMRCESFNFALTDVCMATTAMPGMFKPTKMSSINGKTSVVGVDGGVVMNNPAATTITHVMHNVEEFSYVQDVGDMLVLSLGTEVGKKRGFVHEEVMQWGPLQWAHPLGHIVLDGLSDTVDHLMSMAFRDHRNNYVRIQVLMFLCN
ncbi:hypothetical protein L7F22_060729 [Adiantum nelumboides]|nr:hypothetical protein [Adiantum nelumboides]